jgi:hypothetical protein
MTLDFHSQPGTGAYRPQPDIRLRRKCARGPTAHGPFDRVTFLLTRSASTDVVYALKNIRRLGIDRPAPAWTLTLSLACGEQLHGHG